MESPLEGSQHREPWSQQQRERAAGRYRARLRSRARLRCHVRHCTRRWPRAVRRLIRRGERPCSEGWGAGWPCRSSLAPEDTCADRGGSRSVGGGDAACERLHSRRATGGRVQRLERGRKQVDGIERAVCVWCVCQVWFADASFAGCEEARHRRAMCAMRDSAWARARQRWGRAWLDGEGLCSRTAHYLLSARLPRRRCCGLRRSAEVSNTRWRRRRASVRGVAAALERVSHTDEAYTQERRHRPSSWWRFHRRHPKMPTLWVSLSVFECLWVALGGFECL